MVKASVFQMDFQGKKILQPPAIMSGGNMLIQSNSAEVAGIVFLSESLVYFLLLGFLRVYRLD